MSDGDCPSGGGPSCPGRGVAARQRVPLQVEELCVKLTGTAEHVGAALGIHVSVEQTPGNKGAEMDGAPSTPAHEGLGRGRQSQCPESSPSPLARHPQRAVAPRTAAPWEHGQEASTSCQSRASPRSPFPPHSCLVPRCGLPSLSSQAPRRPQSVTVPGTLHTQKGRCLFEGFFHTASSLASCCMKPFSHPETTA